MSESNSTRSETAGMSTLRRDYYVQTLDDALLDVQISARAMVQLPTIPRKPAASEMGPSQYMDMNWCYLCERPRIDCACEVAA